MYKEEEIIKENTILLWPRLNKYWVIETFNKDGLKYSLADSQRLAPLRKETTVVALNIPTRWVGQLQEPSGAPL